MLFLYCHCTTLPSCTALPSCTTLSSCRAEIACLVVRLSRSLIYILGNWGRWGYTHIQKLENMHMLAKLPSTVIQIKTFTAVCSVIPAMPSCVSTVRLKVTVPMSCRLGNVMLTHSSTWPSPSPTVYTLLSNPTTTTVRKTAKLITFMSVSQTLDTVKWSVHLQDMWHHQVVYGSMLLTYLLTLELRMSHICDTWACAKCGCRIFVTKLPGCRLWGKSLPILYRSPLSTYIIVQERQEGVILGSWVIVNLTTATAHTIFFWMEGANDLQFSRLKCYLWITQKSALLLVARSYDVSWQKMASNK